MALNKEGDLLDSVTEKSKEMMDFRCSLIGAS